MTQHSEELKDLAALTKRYLLQEHGRDDWITTDEQTYNYFKDYALTRRAAPPVVEKPPEPIPQPTTAPKPPPQKAITKPPPPKKAPRESTKPAPAFELSPLGAAPVDDFADIRGILSTKMPSHRILQTPPDDSAVKSYQQRGQSHQKDPEIVVLYSSELPQQRIFLTNLTTALDISLCSSLMVSINDPNSEEILNNPKLRLIVTTEAVHDTVANRKTPILNLGELEVFFKTPKRKADLWKKLREMSESP